MGIGGLLDPDTWRAETECVALALFVQAGDEPDRCRRSVAAGHADEAG